MYLVDEKHVLAHRRASAIIWAGAALHLTFFSHGHLIMQVVVSEGSDIDAMGVDNDDHAFCFFNCKKKEMSD
jgi:hypothetical protein